MIMWTKMCINKDIFLNIRLKIYNKYIFLLTKRPYCSNIPTISPSSKPDFYFTHSLIKAYGVKENLIVSTNK